MGNNSYSLTPRLATAMLVIGLYGSLALNNVSVIAATNLEITPLWNTNRNDSQTCIVTVGTHNGTITFHGIAHQTCSLQVTAPSNVNLRVLIDSKYDKPLFLSVERKGNADCSSRYLSINGHGEQCDVIFVHKNLDVHLQGDATIYLSGISSEDSSIFTCPEAHKGALFGPTVNKTSGCNDIQGYNSTITCPNIKVNPGICIFDFPHNCNATLGNKKVDLQCLDNNIIQYQKAMVIYPPHTAVLILTDNNINALTINTFEDLSQLQVLNLITNYLVTIEAGVFWGLHDLKVLNISNNQLVKLSNDSFQGLVRLSVLDLRDNKLSILPARLFQNLIYLNYLFLDKNHFTTLDGIIFHGLYRLIILALNENMLRVLPANLFNNLYSLEQLFLHRNQLVILDRNLFYNVKKMRILLLHGNELQTLDRSQFEGMTNLKVIALSLNRFKRLPNGILKGLTNLDMLYLSTNQFVELEPLLFKDTPNLALLDISSNNLETIPDIKNLSHLNFFDLQDNPLTRLRRDTFSKLPISTNVYASQHEICECFVLHKSNCSAEEYRSPYLTCNRLLSDKALVVLMWLIGLNALCGNVFVLNWRKTSSQKNKVQDLLLSNLAMSDLLMGIYMITIASADIYFGEYFPMRSEAWRTGITCRIAGTLSILSSEASVFFVTLISIDRFVSTRFPYSTKKLNKKSTIMSCVLIWLFAFALGIIPSALSGVNFQFYDNSHVCIGLPLALTEKYSSEKFTEIICPEFARACYRKDKFKTTSDGFETGMYFSTAVFLGLNCICYLTILACYIEIVRVVYKSSKRAGLNKEMKEQMRLTAKVAAIVATDFACWFPIILLGILVQARVLTLPPSVYAWSVTFVLPINSAINPYLYTIAAIISDRRKRKVGDASSTPKEGSGRTRATHLQTLSTSQLPNVSTA